MELGDNVMAYKTKILNRVLPGYEDYEGNSGGKPVTEEDVFELKLYYAKMLISLWAHACDADGVFHNQEAGMIGQMIHAFFEEGSIFSQYLQRKQEILDRLLETFDNPFPIKSIKEFIENNSVMALNFYEDAVCIVYADGVLASTEREFLDDLAYEFEITTMDKKSIEHKYIPVENV